MMKDETTFLPNGDNYEDWEKEMIYHTELHVDQNHKNASNDNDGTYDRPFKTIQAAANIAKAGCHVLVHKGTYRECVQPAYGGTSPEQMICYEAYEGERVVIKASVVASDFSPSEGWNLIRYDNKKPLDPKMRIWQTKLNPEDFKGYNPFCAVNILHDRLYIEYEKTDMTTYLNRRGMIFCDGKPLLQVSLYNQLSNQPGAYWVEANGQTIHFRLHEDEDPTNHCIELTSREQCFVPMNPFTSYIKVKGLTFAHAATGAPVPQRGAVSCYRGHHWIVENCIVDWSNGVGIDLGNECWHHTHFENQVLGYTVIRGCEIYNVGVCGIAGMFAHHLLIEDNLIQGTGWQKMELSWEAGGMKVHGTRNTLIRRNIFKDTYRADHLWLDVANENNRITQNLFLNGIEQREAIFVECSRDGINLIDNNIFWGVEGKFDENQVLNEPGSTGWYKMEEPGIVNGYAIYGEGTDRLHISNNLICNCRSAGYFAKPVSFRIAANTRGGTSRNTKLFNNIFYDCKEAAIKLPTDNNEVEGNLYVKMPGGYLRILYPAPEVCLDLASWKEFYHFDQEGQEGWFTIQVDTDHYTLEFSKADSYPFVFPNSNGLDRYVKEVEQIQEVKRDQSITTDFLGVDNISNERIPGPFYQIEENRIYSIDPRKNIVK